MHWRTSPALSASTTLTVSAACSFASLVSHSPRPSLGPATAPAPFVSLVTRLACIYRSVVLEPGRGYPHLSPGRGWGLIEGSRDLFTFVLPTPVLGSYEKLRP